MMPDFEAMTTAEIKHYISEHRNDEQEFRSALKVLMARSTDAPKQPISFRFSQSRSRSYRIIETNHRSI
jgi:hypothetical protein